MAKARQFEAKRLFAAFSGLMRAQAGRAALLGPIALMAGAAWRLQELTIPSTFALALIGCLAGAAGFWLGMPRTKARYASAAAVRAGLASAVFMLAWACIGGVAVDARVRLVAAPRLEAQIGPAIVTGWVVAVEAGQSRPRMRLRVQAIEGLERPPIFVQLSPPAGTILPPGRSVRCLAILAPPAAPLFPGAYDPGRRAFFARVGGAGYTLGTCRPIRLQPPDWPMRVHLSVQAIRRDIAQSMADSTPGLGGALAAAVLIGDRTLLDPQSNAAFQNSGLAHLLSVSGLHMSLAAGLAFTVFYGGLALIPGLALRWPLKKIAAAAAMVCALGYLIFSGSSVPAQRAFIMTGAALGAVLLERPAFTMRALAAAAVCVVLIAPESVLDAGFQMSFAATAALVAFFEARAANAALPSPGPIIGTLQGLWDALRASLLISLVAGLATDPIAAFHFQRLTVYGLAANLVAAPLMSFIVAPAAMLALLATPLGWDGPLRLAAWGLELIGGVGVAFGQRPEAVRVIPAMPDASFALFLLAIGWLCVWRGALRWLGLGFAGAALWIYAATAPPILLLDGEAKIVFARNAHGWAVQRLARGGRFAEARLGQRAGLNPLEITRLRDLGCAPHGCQWQTSFAHTIGLALSMESEAQLCGRVDLLIITHAPQEHLQQNPSQNFVPENAQIHIDRASNPKKFGSNFFDDALGANPRSCRTGMRVTLADLRNKGGMAVNETRTGLEVRHALEGPLPPWRQSPQQLAPVSGVAAH